jgi:hypothetical protein
MPERYNGPLKIVCAALALLLVFQISQLFARKDPLTDVSNLPARSPSPPPGAGVRGPSSSMIEPLSPIAPETQSRIDRIVQSEILGVVSAAKPPPMALLGIGGKDAFLRAPNGQTGLLREGDELGGIKLLKIGTNRVLIEQDKQQKELTLFSGFGSDTLLPKKEKNPQ